MYKASKCFRMKADSSRSTTNMKMKVCSGTILLCLLFLFAGFLIAEAQTCKPSGKVRGPKHRSPECDIENDVCCIPGRLYATYKCSPPVTNRTKATLTLDSFERGGDGRGPSKCDNQYHSDDKPVVALSTGWFDNKIRCLNFINIYGNGRSVKTLVVDECDSAMGCDSDHDYLPPCANNVVVASQAVWKALQVPLRNWGEMEIYWSDA